MLDTRAAGSWPLPAYSSGQEATPDVGLQKHVVRNKFDLALRPWRTTTASVGCKQPAQLLGAIDLSYCLQPIISSALGTQSRPRYWCIVSDRCIDYRISRCVQQISGCAVADP